MKETQKKVTEFHARHKFPINIPLQANRNISWLLMWFICRVMIRLSKLALRYWKICGIKDNFCNTSTTNKESFYRVHLVLEEFAEMMEGINNGNLIKAADGLGDTSYVIIGVGVVYGLPAHEISEEVCRSNETKKKRTKDNIRLRDKGKNWQPPNFERALKIGRKRLDIQMKKFRIDELERDLENLCCDELKNKMKGKPDVVNN